MARPQIIKKCKHCQNPFNATCGASSFCSTACHLMGSSRCFGECRIWTAGRDKDGYGMVRLKGRVRRRAHRASYAEFVGSIPDGMMVCHQCDNPRCIRPEHLFLGDAKANKTDCMQKDRHVRGERLYWRAKLTEDDVRAIRKDTRRPSKIAPDYGVTKEMIGAILNRKSWKHVI